MNFADFHFAEPRWLWLAVIAPVLLAWLQLHAAKKRREQLAKMASPQFVEQLTTSHSPVRRRVKEVLLVLSLVLAALALARPQWGNFESGNAFLGEDVVFVLDCSQSMTATDVAPNRLQRAKFSILDFIQKKEHGRVGLVAFAGSAFLQCPLTFDSGAFEETLMGIDEKTIPIPGTDIGRALNEASRAMDKKARRKMVVLITDGEDLEKSGVMAAKRLATNGVVVFTIGVGTPAGKEISTLNPAGQMELLRDAKGEVVRSQLDEKTLREIAQATGGSYFPLGNLGDGLLRVHSAMHTLETTGGLRASARRGVERFYVPLALLVLLVAIEPLIGTRRKKTAAVMMVFCILLLPAANVAATEPTNSPTPETARDFYNAGTKLLGGTNYSQVEKLFQSALAMQDEQVQPLALFNLGHVRFAEGQAILKKGPDAQKVSAQGKAALAAGEKALSAGEASLADKQLQAMVESYFAGRGARRELRAAEKAVKAAMDAFGKTLTKWQRAADDFKGAAEMNPADTNAIRNAQLLDERIAKLVDSLRQMQQMAGAMAGQKQQLDNMLGKLKGQIPAPDAPPGGKGEGDEEEGEGSGKGEIKPEALAGKEEGEGRNGEEMQAPLSPNQAGQMLDGLPVDGSKRLPMGGDKEGTPPKEKNGRNW